MNIQYFTKNNLDLKLFFYFFKKVAEIKNLEKLFLTSRLKVTFVVPVLKVSLASISSTQW